MRTEDFTALVKALLPVDDGTAAFLYAKQAALAALGVRQLLFFLAETTPLRSRLADSALMELLNKCGLAAEDDLRLVRSPQSGSLAPAAAASQSEDNAPHFVACAASDDSAPCFRSLSATDELEDAPSAMDDGAAQQHGSLAPAASQLEEDETAVLRRKMEHALTDTSLTPNTKSLLQELWEALIEAKAEAAEDKKRLQEARAELEDIKGGRQGTTARRVLSLIMRAAFTAKGKSKRDIFQPCAYDLEVLEMARDDKGKRIIDDLHNGDLSNFLSKLWPTDASSDEALNDSIFHHNTKESSTRPVYEDQKARAESIARVVKQLVDGGINRAVRVRLLDGHGRMLLSIINAVKELGLSPEDNLKFQVFEIDEEVKEWHAAVFPKAFVETRHMSITSPDAHTNCEREDILYLNFCSVPTRLSRLSKPSPMDQLVSYLNNEASEPCNKESVLTFMAERVQQKTHVMISFFVVTPHQNGQSRDARVDNMPRGLPSHEVDAAGSSTDEVDAAGSSTDEDEAAPQEVRGGSNNEGACFS